MLVFVRGSPSVSWITLPMLTHGEMSREGDRMSSHVVAWVAVIRVRRLLLLLWMAGWAWGTTSLQLSQAQRVLPDSLCHNIQETARCDRLR